MGVNSCCVVNCKNNAKNSKCSFYRFPISKHKIEQRTKWIKAIKMKNADGSQWLPKSHHRICSAHFIGNNKSDNQFSPSYVPTIFSDVERRNILQQQQILNRHNRFMKRRFTNSTHENVETLVTTKEESISDQIDEPYMDQGCQVDFSECNSSSEKTFFCTRYVYGGEKCDVEIQTEICVVPKKIVISSHKTFEDLSIQCDLGSCEKHFIGFSSLKNDEQFLDLAGVSSKNFELLLSAVRNSDKYSISRENRLLIFLINKIIE